MRAIDPVSWQTIQRVAGPHGHWPNRPVYCWGEAARMDRDHLDRLHRQMTAEGWEVHYLGPHVFLVGPTTTELEG